MFRLFAFWIALLGLVLSSATVAAQTTPPAAPSSTTTPALSAGAAGEGAGAGRPEAPQPGTSGEGAASATAPSAPADTDKAEGAEQSAAVDGSTYAVRMRDLAQRIDDLKEQIRRSHTRLSLLSDTILSGGVGGARAEIRFVNDLSSAFRLTSALFVLDGQVQYNKQDDSGALAEQKSIPVFTGSIPPGDHTLQVQLKLQGYGYGVFSYLRGYRFQTGASHSFTVTEGKVIVLEAIAWEKGGVTTPLEERPAVRFKQTVKAGSGESGAARGPAGSTRAGSGASANASVGGK
ncbi:MAG: hypothetical protein JW751_22580 [Polyangiaceae bacterium]|nr:hypothetical protein [Polyangiaceae bacterium]